MLLYTDGRAATGELNFGTHTHTHTHTHTNTRASPLTLTSHIPGVGCLVQHLKALDAGQLPRPKDRRWGGCVALTDCWRFSFSIQGRKRHALQNRRPLPGKAPTRVRGGDWPSQTLSSQENIPEGFDGSGGAAFGAAGAVGRSHVVWLVVAL